MVRQLQDPAGCLKSRHHPAMPLHRDEPPATDDPPDHIIREVTLTATLAANGTWEINCPTWNCQMHSKHLTKQAAVILAEIETHNEEILQGEPDWAKDPKKAFEAHVLGRDWEKIQASKRHATLCRERNFPDPGTMTPGRSIYPDGRYSL